MFLEDKKQGEATLEPWRELLLKTADEIENRGWCQGRPENLSGQVCFIGGMAYASGATDPDSWNFDASKIATLAYVRFREFLYGDPVSWNDAVGQTKENVINTIRKCAKQTI